MRILFHQHNESIIIIKMVSLYKLLFLFVWLDSLGPSQQFLGHVRMGLSRLNE